MAKTEWLIGNPPKISEKYLEVELTASYICTSQGGLVLSEENVAEYPELQRVIHILPQIWDIPFLGYNLWIRSSYDYEANIYLYTYEVIILSLDKLKLRNWRCFQSSQFYKSLPKDICGIILHYIYDDMIIGFDFQIYQDDNDTSEILKKIRDFYSEYFPRGFLRRNGNKKTTVDWYNDILTKFDSDYERGVKRCLIPVKMPRYFETESAYPLL